jgi:predicted TIM-barrel fold metal-dependent hydrolase
VHPVPRSADEIRAYLPMPWRDRYKGERRSFFLNPMEMVDAEHLLMFSSDYPHWDFDSPTRAFPALPEPLREAIFSDNARSFYNLGR